MIVTGRQIRAARALAGWSMTELARAAGLHENTIRYWESTVVIPAGGFSEPVACAQIRRTFAAIGVIFTTRPAVGVMSKIHNFSTPLRRRARPRHGVKHYCQAQKTATRKSRPVLPVPPSGPQLCGARTRQGRPCVRRALRNGRCRNHGGASTGPLTEAGRARIGIAQRKRWQQWRARKR